MAATTVPNHDPGAEAAVTFEKRTTVHAFRDDSLGEHDAVGLAAAIRRGEVGAAEVARDAAARPRAGAEPQPRHRPVSVSHK
ncbi:hypothetical protein ACFWIN_32835, partial [Streptomyces sp. NPDC127049]